MWVQKRVQNFFFEIFFKKARKSVPRPKDLKRSHTCLLVRINPYLSTASTYTSSMSCENQSLNKRRRCGEAPSSHDPRLLGATIAGAQVAAQSPAVEHESFESEYRAAGVVAACRVALLESPRACHSALAKYGSSIDSALARALRIGGSCKINEVVSSE
jgi:hypothetical protein